MSIPQATSAGTREPTLQVRDLSVHFHTLRGRVRAVNGVSFDLYPGERFGLVGESGSGKTTTALAILRMIKPPGRIESGEILLDGQDLLDLGPEEVRRYRLAEVAMIPQGAMNSLNPVSRIKKQFLLSMKAHDATLSKKAMEDRVAELLTWVGLRPDVADLFPHELSGGMKQRVCIAMAISLHPKVIIADEPTSALDVVVQRQVMLTLERVQAKLGASVILVGHDMGLMAQAVDRIGVMYGGKLVEVGPVRDIFKNPIHPYTQLLISSLPSLEKRGVFNGIAGAPLSLLRVPSGCVFHPRCPLAEPGLCDVEIPQLQELMPGRWAACHVMARKFGKAVVPGSRQMVKEK